MTQQQTERKTIQLSRDSNRFPEFKVTVRWGDLTRTRLVAVRGPVVTIRLLMKEIANGDTELTEPDGGHGTMHASDAYGRCYVMATWHTAEKPKGRFDEVEISTTNGDPVDPDDEDVSIGVECEDDYEALGIRRKPAFI